MDSHRRGVGADDLCVAGAAPLPRLFGGAGVVALVHPSVTAHVTRDGARDVTTHVTRDKTGDAGSGSGSGSG
jgi:hypothetical protein